MLWGSVLAFRDCGWYGVSRLRRAVGRGSGGGVHSARVWAWSLSVASAFVFFFFQAEDGIRDHCVTGVQTCALSALSAALPQTGQLRLGRRFRGRDPGIFLLFRLHPAAGRGGQLLGTGPAPDGGRYPLHLAQNT